MKEKAPNVTASKAKQSQVVTIDASGIFYRDLNAKLRQLVLNETRKIALHNVYGQRYIGTDLDKPAEIEIFGTPGNDLGAFMNGSRIIVHGNAQDGCGNTMNDGEIIVHGHAGDIIGLSARGGKIFIQDSVGYRAGIHMKEYQDRKPMIVIGGTAQDFLGEYMVMFKTSNWAKKWA
jgi:glutamate synthase domain-containing protein 3